MSDPDPSLSYVGVYGITMATDLDLVAPLPERAPPADLHVTQRDQPFDIDPDEIIRGGSDIASDGLPTSGRFREGEIYFFRFADAVDFRIEPNHITYYLRDDFYAYGIELWLLGIVLAFWLEWQGTPALHASAAVIDGNAVGFMASNRGGKTSLATACMQQGYPLLTDDILAVHVTEDAAIGQPAFPQMRMWPEHAAHFVEDAEALDTVHPYIEKRRVPVDDIGPFTDTPHPLRAIYLPDRQDEKTSVDIEPVSSSEAVIELVRESFVATLVEAAGFQPERLQTLSQLVQHVPVRRLIYPSGVEHLPRVVEAVRDDAIAP